MCHVSMRGKRNEKCFDTYGNKSEKTSRGQHEHTRSHKPLILSGLVCVIRALLEVTDSVCVCV